MRYLYFIIAASCAARGYSVAAPVALGYGTEWDVFVFAAACALAITVCVVGLVDDQP